MKSLKVFLCFLPFFLSHQSFADVAVLTTQQMLCYSDYDQYGVAFVGEYLQHFDVSEVPAPGETYFISTYLVQYSLQELWCGAIKTEWDEPAGIVPEWAEDIQNTETEVWIVVRIYNDTWNEPSLSQRQFVTAYEQDGGYYVLSETYGYGDQTVDPGPVNVTDDNMITGYLTSWSEVQTMSLSDFAATLSECSSCNISTGVDQQAVEMTLFPNPAVDYVQFQSVQPLATSTFSIYSVNGKLVKTGSLQDNKKIDTADLTTGLYFLSIQDVNGINGVSEFVKE